MPAPPKFPLCVFRDAETPYLALHLPKGTSDAKAVRLQAALQTALDHILLVYPPLTLHTERGDTVFLPVESVHHIWLDGGVLYCQSTENEINASISAQRRTQEENR